MRLSVIIPVYNAENYLQSTVESVLKQNCGSFEVILVDDGSVDSSPQICDSLAAEDKRINVVHKKNGGVSSARNAGIEAAKGKYLTFVDADDKVAQCMFSDLLAECESKKADKAFCGFAEVHRDGSSTDIIAELPSRQLLNRDFIVNTMLCTGCSTDSYMNSVCGSLYKAEIIRNHNLRFADRPMGEDWLFNMQFCDVCQSAVYIAEPYYLYLRNGASATSRFQPRQFELWLENRRFRRQLTEKYKFETDETERDTKWITKVLFYALEVISHDGNYKQRLREMFGNKEFCSALKNTATVNPKFFIPVRWLLKNNMLTPAIALLRIYALRIKE